MRPVTSTDSRLLSKVDNSGFRGPLTRVRLSPTSQGISCPRIRTHRARLRRMSKSTDAPRAKSERSTESAKALLRVASSLDKHSHHSCPDRAEQMHRKHLLARTFGRGICGTVAAIVPLYLLTRVVSVTWGAVWLPASATALVVPLKSDSNASQEVQRVSAHLPSGIVVANVASPI
jgi:hypothetical protein